MKIKEGFILRTICGQSVVSGEGTSNVNFSKLVSLNDSADLLLAEYDVDRETALKDAEALCAQWKEIGIAE